jgi:hypothetical protein
VFSTILENSLEKKSYLKEEKKKKIKAYSYSEED